MTLLAFHNDPTIKAKYLERVAQHRAADQLMQHYGYWKDGKGCAVGCTIHSGEHMAYESEIGIPVMLARLEDTIFEGLPVGDAQQWPERFLSAARVGADLNRVGWKLLYWLLTTPEVNPGIEHELAREAVKQCADVIAPLCEGRPAAESAARSAARSAWSAASAASAARSAASAAWSAAWSAESAARAAESAAESAARSAESAASAARSAAWSAARSAESAAWGKIADKLIELMEAA